MNIQHIWTILMIFVLNEAAELKKPPRETPLNVRNCPVVQREYVKLHLYNRSNPRRPIILNSTDPSEIDPDKKIIMIVHGWLWGPLTSNFFKMRDAYLQRYDCNVIIVDWSAPARNTYTFSYCAVPQVGSILADFLCAVKRTYRISLEEVHILGHSLGAQVAGFVGQETMKWCCGKVGRITGLDPAGPRFQNLPTDVRLDQADAEFVDVIHTNAGALGYFGDCGDVDFYVNCGTIQPGCHLPDLKVFITHPMETAGCTAELDTRSTLNLCGAASSAVVRTGMGDRQVHTVLTCKTVVFLPSRLHYLVSTSLSILKTLRLGVPGPSTPKVSCDHFRSVDVMIEGITSDKFRGRLCADCQMLCAASEEEEEVTMGEDCPRNASGSYVLFTHSEEPYAKGW